MVVSIPIQKMQFVVFQYSRGLASTGIADVITIKTLQGEPVSKEDRMNIAPADMPTLRLNATGHYVGNFYKRG